MKWKPDWQQAKQNHIRWWNRDGMVLWLTAGRADQAVARAGRPGRQAHPAD